MSGLDLLGLAVVAVLAYELVLMRRWRIRIGHMKERAQRNRLNV